MSIAVIFPAFTDEYSGSEEKLLNDSNYDFRQRLEQASGILNCDLTGFNFRTNNFLKDEEKTQYISYIFSCCVADILTAQNITPSFVSGYSMGIYAALCYCRTISFADGLRLVKHAWEIISAATGGKRYGMGMIIGLEENDILKIISTEKGIEICNRNNRHTFIISGLQNVIEKTLVSAKNEGALKTSLLTASKPYHSGILKSCIEPFRAVAGNIRFAEPLYKYVSSLDQQVIDTGSGLKNEVIQNLSERMNWLGTMNSMINSGADVFFECGAGDGLTRNSRFVNGTFRSFSINKFEAFLQCAS